MFFECFVWFLLFGPMCVFLCCALPCYVHCAVCCVCVCVFIVVLFAARVSTYVCFVCLWLFLSYLHPCFCFVRLFPLNVEFRV